MIENLREDLDNCGETDVALTGLSKVFDFINHNLLIAKLTAYGAEKSSLDFIHSYITKWKKDKNRIIFLIHEKPLGVSRWSILGPLLCNIYIWHMFFKAPSNIAFVGYVDDNTPYTYSLNIQTALNNLQKHQKNSFIGFLRIIL